VNLSRLPWYVRCRLGCLLRHRLGAVRLAQRQSSSVGSARVRSCWPGPARCSHVVTLAALAPPVSPTLLSDAFRALGDTSAATHDFTEEPVPLTTFITDRHYLANPSLSDEQYEAVRHIEKIYYPETYQLLAKSSDKEVRDYWSAPCRMINLATLEWGLTRQGSRQGPYLPD
jgi:hypothetical protein